MGTVSSGPEGRFPFPPPFGWFAVGRADELATGAVSTVHLQGKDLVVWHDPAAAGAGNGDGEDRGWRVFDAYCPHLGAHLGVGGRVDDGCLVCPFHEWSFHPDGTNAAIPYADRPNRKARVRSYPTAVRNGLVLFWHHPDPDVAPRWDVPQALTDDFVEVGRYTWTVRTAWQEVAENSVDMAHFRSVHGLERVGQIGEITLDGPVRRVQSTQLFNSARGTFEGALESTSYGPGVGVIHFDLMGRVTMVSATTPVDEDAVEVRFTLYHSGDEIAAKIGDGFAAEVARQFHEDIPIWENKRYQPSPALAPTERAVTEFRRWAAQFYPEIAAPVPG
jgi:phenylpropionate dioxygenase-like ring-hydroxylating dioxygenase large terminal subunit